MISQASQFVGTIPENYDQGLGPHIFHDYAQNLVDRATKACSHLTTGSVLEIASGTGIVTRKLRNALPPDINMVASDLNPPMLKVAQSKFSADEKVTFKPADAMALPFGDAEFDLLLCQFGVMFFPDKIQAFREAARVLKSDGRYIFNVWGTMEDNPFSALTHAAVENYFRNDPPGFYKVPFSYTNQGQVMFELEAGGFKDIKCETIRLDKHVSDWALFARGLVYGNPLIDEIKSRGGVDPDVIMQSILDALHGAFGPEPGSMPLLANVYSGSVA
ncbi:class I SAM-dependent methyltransferase [Kiloniella antarctica]|uniref:Class I SAM-dependent methyltransferase n=1 Tax=Kiloniella antarctica TaxID=1550907 RepID=A0ABW5BHT6_9PROT